MVWAMMPIELSPCGDDVAGLRVINVAAVDADALQQHAVRVVARGLDRAGEIEGERPGVARRAIIDEIAVDVAAAATVALRDDADGAIALGDDIAGLRIIDVAGVAAADGLQQRAMRAVALGQD